MQTRLVRAKDLGDTKLIVENDAWLILCDDRPAGLLELVRERLPGVPVLFHFHTPYYGLDELLLDAGSRNAAVDSLQACRRAARTIFLGSAPTTQGQTARGIELERIVLGAAQPDQQTGRFKDAVRRLNDRLHYLNSANNRFWLDVRPNLRREMEDRKRRFQDKEHVFPAIRDRAQRARPARCAHRARTE